MFLVMMFVMFVVGMVCEDGCAKTDVRRWMGEFGFWGKFAEG